jgi:DNA-binding IclR family transcriptional regulator
VRLPLSTGDIAGLVGIDHSHASRLLRTMRHEGLIDVSRGWIIVPNPALLNRDTRQMHDPHWQLRKTAPPSVA